MTFESLAHAQRKCIISPETGTGLRDKELEESTKSVSSTPVLFVGLFVCLTSCVWKREICYRTDSPMAFWSILVRFEKAVVIKSKRSIPDGLQGEMLQFKYLPVRLLV